MLEQMSLFKLCLNLKKWSQCHTVLAFNNFLLQVIVLKWVCLKNAKDIIVLVCVIWKRTLTLTRRRKLVRWCRRLNLLRGNLFKIFNRIELNFPFSVYWLLFLFWWMIMLLVFDDHVL
jgi:molybdopterin/thiamine biosynthesis adenylyltransferase